MLLVDLAVAPHLLHHLESEVGRKAETGIKHGVLAGLTQELADARIVGSGQLRLDVGRGEPVLLGLDRGHDRPVDDLRPLGVTVAHRRGQGLLGEGVLEDHQRLGAVGVARAEAAELAEVGGPAVAAVFLEGHLQQLGRVERQHLGHVEAEARELGGDVALGGGAAGHAHDQAREIFEALEARIGRHHHPLTVVEVGLQERGPLCTVSGGGPGGVPHEHVDLAGLERREAVVGLEVDELHRFGVTQDRSRDHPAEVGVEAHVLAVLEHGEAGQLVAGATADHARLLDRSQCLARLGATVAPVVGASVSATVGRRFGGRPGVVIVVAPRAGPEHQSTRGQDRRTSSQSSHVDSPSWRARSRHRNRANLPGRVGTR